MSFLPGVKNSIVILSFPKSSNFAASSLSSWQFAAIVGAFLFLGKDSKANNSKNSNCSTRSMGFFPQINEIRDCRHNCGGSLRRIEEQLDLNSGGCILGSIVPK
jgi:hypothetical protein